MAKKKENSYSDEIKSLIIENEVVHLENENLKADIIDLKRIIVSQSFEIERLRGMNRLNNRSHEVDNIIEKYNGKYTEYQVLDDGTISHIDTDDDSE